jgi:RNA polymerase sigma-70 factor (ECF subfamily)
METSGVLDRGRTTARKQAKAADGRAELAEVYDDHAAAVYRYLLTLLLDTQDAEDALQEVFLGILRRRGKPNIENMQAYLFRAARNQALMVLRKRRNQDRRSAAATVCWIDVDACAQHDREVAIDIARALQQLPLEQREVIALKLGEDLTFAEIGKALGISQNTAASRYRLALARLRRLLVGATDDA